MHINQIAKETHTFAWLKRSLTKLQMHQYSEFLIIIEENKFH